ncbi:MAG: hypothetical protein WC758_02735 [Candidatus Woesearchaeota archaeon]|jgi:hypothetical protein
MARGRPVGSVVRQNVVEILYFLGTGHGYHIFKIYKQVYPKITLRGIYYHLKKGRDLGEFEIDTIHKEKGEYSWGAEAEKIYYKLGKNAKPKIDHRIKALLDSKPELLSVKQEKI